MGARLTPAEAVLFRTGPNCITILFETSGRFDPARARLCLHQVVDGADRFRRRLHAVPFSPRFGAEEPVDWPDHLSVLRDPSVTAPALLHAMRGLHLDPARPLWRAVLVNPDGKGWSGVALHFDHAIADGTRISRHILKLAKAPDGHGVPIDDLPVHTMAELAAAADKRLTPPQPGLVRIPFEALARRLPDVPGHGDRLLHLAREVLSDHPAFLSVSAKRKAHASVARIEALRSADGALGNRANMQKVFLGRGTAASAKGLFSITETGLAERARMGLARFVPPQILRPVVQAEFSTPGIILTIVPVARRIPPLFGLDLRAIHPAAPALGRPPIAVTAVRLGDGFDVSIVAHGAEPNLSEAVARQMGQSLQ